MIGAKSLIFWINDDTSVRKGVFKAVAFASYKGEALRKTQSKCIPGRV